ncbi:Folate transporter 1, chloroplastic [Morella rubra]|uniref:Folate transporter 1, chloroplastic n=1 Tax=Morella rubra TaxID=262757 RepID=A0A6A1UN74_9ROSI|nr:Folate transporter 1, chloroplastic [Morella rubra]
MTASQSQSELKSKSERWQWETAIAGAIAGFATVAVMQPLDVVRTRFQGTDVCKKFTPSAFINLLEVRYNLIWFGFAVNDGRVSNLPTYKNTPQAIFTIARLEGLRGLYAGFAPAVVGSSVSWGLYFYFYDRAKQRHSKNKGEKLSPGLHLASAAEAGALVATNMALFWMTSVCLNEVPISYINLILSFHIDALRTIIREEGWSALYKGIVPSLFLVSHGAIQFTVYEELRKVIVDFRSKYHPKDSAKDDKLLSTIFAQKSVDYAVLGASSKMAAILLTYPFQVVRARLQQRPSSDGIPRYMDSWHVVKETARFEGVKGFYKGITPNLLKNVPAASITFIVYENVLKLLKIARRKD